jgi:hypothetical protein
VRREARQPPAKRVVNETFVLNRPRQGAKLREEVWQTEEGEVTKYNLAYINHLVCQVDNGRVLAGVYKIVSAWRDKARHTKTLRGSEVYVLSAF